MKLKPHFIVIYFPQNQSEAKAVSNKRIGFATTRQKFRCVAYICFELKPAGIYLVQHIEYYALKTVFRWKYIIFFKYLN